MHLLFHFRASRHNHDNYRLENKALHFIALHYNANVECKILFEPQTNEESSVFFVCSFAFSSWLCILTSTILFFYIVIDALLLLLLLLSTKWLALDWLWRAVHTIYLHSDGYFIHRNLLPHLLNQATNQPTADRPGCTENEGININSLALARLRWRNKKCVALFVLNFKRIPKWSCTNAPFLFFCLMIYKMVFLCRCCFFFISIVRNSIWVIYSFIEMYSRCALRRCYCFVIFT